jgi:hypothetical protein
MASISPASTTPPIRRTRALLITAGGSLLAGLLTTMATSGPALAQRVVPKLSSLCPLGYVDTLNGKCSTLGLMEYQVQASNGQPCPSGWFDVGGGYCRRK